MEWEGEGIVSVLIHDILSEVKYLVEHTMHFDNVHGTPPRQLWQQVLSKSPTLFLHFKSGVEDT